MNENRATMGELLRYSFFENALWGVLIIAVAPILLRVVLWRFRAGLRTPVSGDLDWDIT